MVGVNTRTLNRFWAKVEVDHDTGCWLWQAGRDGKGYGQFAVGEKNVLAHRFAWQLERGPIPEGLQIDHLCRVRHCVNPDHLEPVTARTNTLRGISISAANATKTECIHGHPFDDANTRIASNGTRHCRTCDRDREREARARRRSATVGTQPGGRVRCGTVTGYTNHQRAGERPCDACVAAKAAYNKRWREAPERTRRNRMYAAAQGRAKQRLVEMFPDTYAALYAEERDAALDELDLLS